MLRDVGICVSSRGNFNGYGDPGLRLKLFLSFWCYTKLYFLSLNRSPSNANRKNRNTQL